MDTVIPGAHEPSAAHALLVIHVLLSGISLVDYVFCVRNSAGFYGAIIVVSTANIKH